LHHHSANEQFRQADVLARCAAIGAGTVGGAACRAALRALPQAEFEIGGDQKRTDSPVLKLCQNLVRVRDCRAPGSQQELDVGQLLFLFVAINQGPEASLQFCRSNAAEIFVIDNGRTSEVIWDLFANGLDQTVWTHEKETVEFVLLGYGRGFVRDLMAKLFVLCFDTALVEVTQRSARFLDSFRSDAALVFVLPLRRIDFKRLATKQSQLSVRRQKVSDTCVV
jgi:hypothetical protein